MSSLPQDFELVGGASEESFSIEEILARIDDLSDADNLAAVLIHFNDTYFIEERSDSGIPGMARIAWLVAKIRAYVRERLGEDRTLVLHSGDFLSPSSMSREFKGEPMLELLNLCKLDYATLGNHEFDFESLEGPRILVTRLKEANFEIVQANLTPPAHDSDYKFHRLVLWPSTHPFMALTGIAGEQTSKKATEKRGFAAADPLETARGIMAELKQHPEVGALIVLTHMNREEDKTLQKFLSDSWHRRGFVYILGGHDHHIDWRERDRPNCLLSKCLSNCRSVVLVLIPKDGLAALEERLIRPDLDRQMTQEELIEFGRHEFRQRLLRAEGRAAEVSLTDDAKADALASVVDAYRRMVPQTIRKDFQSAFEKRIAEAFSYQGGTIQDAIKYRSLSFYTLDWAVNNAVDSGFHTGALEIKHPEHLFGLPEDKGAQEQIKIWQSRMPGSSSGGRVIADFSGQIAEPKMMNATDAALRSRSTDFGNFVADAVKVGLQSDLALINAGSFRIDGFVPARITEGLLRDIFIYDGAEAVIVVTLTAEEVREFHQHALRKVGQGGFLQTTGLLDDSPGYPSSLSVALVKHMLADGEDGFQGILASKRGWTPEDMVRRLGPLQLRSASLLAAIEAGAPNVVYDKSTRISGKLTLGKDEGLVLELIELVDQYLIISRRYGIHLEASLDILTRRADLTSELAVELKQLAERLQQFAGSILWEQHMKDFYTYLVHSPHVLRRGIRYQDFLDRAAEGFVDY